MKYLLISLLFLASVAVSAQIVNIPDANFKAYLIGNPTINTNGDGEIQVSEASPFKGDIWCPRLNILDMTGIEAFTALNTLWCPGNQLTSLDLVKNIALIDLNCSDNQLTALDLSKNLGLDKLYCQNNLLTALDIKSTSLRILGCGNNQLTILDISAITGLTSLYCGYNQLSNLNISKNSSLTNLDCKNNLLNTLDVSKNTALISLRCGNNQLANLDVSWNTALQSLTCEYNQLASLDVNTNTALTELGCGDNQLTVMDLSNNSALKHLNCINNQLPVLDISNNTSLGSLECSYNLLSSLDVSKHIKLTLLICGSNSLSSLDVSKNTELENLGCDYNQLTILDVSKNPLLRSLSCSNNQIDDLDLSNKTVLFHLDFNNNKLTNVDFGKNGNLKYLSCTANELKTISNLPNKLITLVCNDNKDLKCLSKLPESLVKLYINNTSIKCMPNAVNITSSDVDIKSYPICDIQSGCPYYGNISGNIHLNTSANCQLDGLNPGPKIKNVKVNLYNNGTIEKQYYSNFFGDFIFVTDPDDSFLVKVDPLNNPFDITCPISKEYQVVVTPTDNVKGDLNFGLTCKGTPEYGVSSISATRFRPAVLTEISVNAGDIAKSFHGIDCGYTHGGTVKTEIIGPVTYVNPGRSALTPSAVSNDNKSLIYYVSDFGSLKDSSFNIEAITKSPITLADSVVYIKVTVIPDSTDNNPSNDTLTMCFPVRNSYDPNAKEVFPDTRVAGDKWVNYTIHFQNMGNDTAYLVVIKDSLSPLLNLSSFQFLNSSHRVVTELESNILTFTFPKINLVDSLKNEKLSHGWVQFKIKTDPSVDEFTQIENTASIYFDTNDPIVTNIAYINLKQLSTSASDITTSRDNLLIFPNPAKNTITVNLKTDNNYNLTVSNTFGQEVIQQTFQDKSCTVLLDGLAPGIYFVSVKHEHGYWVGKVVKE